MNHLEKDGWLLCKVNPIVEFWSYNNAFIIKAFKKMWTPQVWERSTKFFLKKLDNFNSSIEKGGALEFFQ